MLNEILDILCKFYLRKSFPLISRIKRLKHNKLKRAGTVITTP